MSPSTLSIQQQDQTVNEELSLFELTTQDSRYPVDAYLFVRDALAYAADSEDLEAFEQDGWDEFGCPTVEHHFTGQQLCEAIRLFAINQFGFMAKIVLKHWNIDATSCFGDLVYNMIAIGLMKKSDQDRREDFDDVYQFDLVFETDVEISPSTVIQ